MSRRPCSYLVTVDGVGLAKPTAIRAKAMRARRWWSKRIGVEPTVLRLRPVSS